jgi:hypothetical protein
VTVCCIVEIAAAFLSSACAARATKTGASPEKAIPPFAINERRRPDRSWWRGADGGQLIGRHPHRVRRQRILAEPAVEEVVGKLAIRGEDDRQVTRNLRRVPLADRCSDACDPEKLGLGRAIRPFPSSDAVMTRSVGCCFGSRRIVNFTSAPASAPCMRRNGIPPASTYRARPVVETAPHPQVTAANPGLSRRESLRSPGPASLARAHPSGAHRHWSCQPRTRSCRALGPSGSHRRARRVGINDATRCPQHPPPSAHP